jgi:hypothetical protein
MTPSPHLVILPIEVFRDLYDASAVCESALGSGGFGRECNTAVIHSTFHCGSGCVGTAAVNHCSTKKFLTAILGNK